MKIGNFSTQINPVKTNPGHKKQEWPVPSYSRNPSLIIHKENIFSITITEWHEQPMTIKLKQFEQ